MCGKGRYLRALQRSQDVAIILVHHVSKRARAQQGQAMRGTSDLHAWTDCAAYLAWQNKQLHLTLEHRAAKPPPPMAINLVSGPDGQAAHLEIQGEVAVLEPAGQPSLATRLLKIIRNSPKPISRTELRRLLKVNNEKLGEVLTALQAHGRIHRTPQGWAPATSPATANEQGQLPLT